MALINTGNIVDDYMCKIENTTYILNKYDFLING